MNMNVKLLLQISKLKKVEWINIWGTTGYNEICYQIVTSIRWMKPIPKNICRSILTIWCCRNTRSLCRKQPAPTTRHIPILKTYIVEKCRKLCLVLRGNNPTKCGHEVLKVIANYTYIKGSYGFDVVVGLKYGVVSSWSWSKSLCDPEMSTMEIRGVLKTIASF